MLAAEFYDLLVMIVLALLAIGGGLVAATLAHHGYVSLQLRRRARRGAELLPLLCQAVSDPARLEELTSELRRSDRPVLLPMMLQLALDLRGEELERIAALAEEIGLARSERRRLRSLSATTRAEAAKNLRLLHVRDALPQLLRLIQKDRHRSVRLASAWAAGEIGGSEAIRGLLEMLDDPAPGVVRRIQEVLLDTAPHAAAEVVRHTRASENPAVRRAGVELLGALRDPEASELLLELVGADDREIRTKAVKAAAAIGDPRFSDVFRELLRDGAWSVRCQAATGLGAIGAVDSVAELSAAMADPVWWVRFNAASSLAELGDPGRAALAEATTEEDARGQVASYVLQRTGLTAVAS